MDWQREQNMAALTAQLAGVDAIIANEPNNLMAWRERLSIIKEFNASSGQHSSTLTTANKTLAINVVKRDNKVIPSTVLDATLPQEAIGAAPVPERTLDATDATTTAIEATRETEGV
jgi:hypothetical protein